MPKIGHDSESLKLETLPNNIMPRVLSYLNAMDIFKVTLVSTSWRHLVMQNEKDLKNVDYSVEKYLNETTLWKHDFGIQVLHSVLLTYVYREHDRDRSSHKISDKRSRFERMVLQLFRKCGKFRFSISYQHL